MKSLLKKVANIKKNLQVLLQFCTLVDKRDISFGVVSSKGEIYGDFSLPITRSLPERIKFEILPAFYCACVG